MDDVFDGRGNGKSFHFTGDPGSLVLSYLGAKKASKMQFVGTEGRKCGAKTIHFYRVIGDDPKLIVCLRDHDGLVGGTSLLSLMERG